MDQQGAASQQIRILAIDDDEANLTVLGAILRAAGHRVSVARSGEEGIALARRLLPDIILLDVQMPKMDGYQAAEALSGGGETRSIPIVMVTALTEGQDRVRALKAGAVDFLSKPVQPEELTAKVRTLARLKAYNDSLESQKTELIAEVEDGLYISFAALTPDPVSGEVSATVDFGFRIEQGKLAYPVKTAMVGSDASEILGHIDAVSSDYREEPGIIVPSLRIRDIQVIGAE